MIDLFQKYHPAINGTAEAKNLLNPMAGKYTLSMTPQSNYGVMKMNGASYYFDDFTKDALVMMFGCANKGL